MLVANTVQALMGWVDREVGEIVCIYGLTFVVSCTLLNGKWKDQIYPVTLILRVATVSERQRIEEKLCYQENAALWVICILSNMFLLWLSSKIDPFTIPLQKTSILPTLNRFCTILSSL